MTHVSSHKAGTSDVARHIARTAARLFAERGYDATSVRAIVEAAGVTKPTLYYHFGSKEGLAHALLNLPLSGLVQALRAIADQPGKPVEIIERLFEAHFAFCREDPDRARFYYAIAFGPLAYGLAAELSRFVREIDEPLERAIRCATEAGIVMPGRQADMLLACRGLITAAVIEFLYEDKNQDLGPDLARRLVGDLLHGFGTRGSQRGESPE